MHPLHDYLRRWVAEEARQRGWSKYRQRKELKKYLEMDGIREFLEKEKAE